MDILTCNMADPGRAGRQSFPVSKGLCPTQKSGQCWWSSGVCRNKHTSIFAQLCTHSLIDSYRYLHCSNILAGTSNSGEHNPFAFQVIAPVSQLSKEKIRRRIMNDGKIQEINDISSIVHTVCMYIANKMKFLS